jgi:pyruvate/2-oxoglutarate/acetoin dehydrogenase E1 component
MKVLLSIAAFAYLSSPALAWDGYDWESGSHVEIGKGNLVREGRDIEIYDWGTGEYRGVTVEDMRSTGSGVEVEVYDHETGENRTLDME